MGSFCDDYQAVPYTLPLQDVIFFPLRMFFPSGIDFFYVKTMRKG